MNPSTIVCPIEFALSDEYPLARALSLARWHQATLHVVHVVASDPKRGGVPEGDRVALEERIQHVVDAFDPAGVAVVPAVVAGDAVSAVADYIRRVEADLVVVGRVGRSTRGYRTIGAFASALSRVVECPLIAVPEEDTAPRTDGLFRNVLSAVDFSEASLRGLKQALDLAQESAGRLTVLHVLDAFPYESVYSGAHALTVLHDQQARIEQTNGDLRALIPPDALDWCDVEVETVSGDPANAIVGAARERRADLIVLGTSLRSRLDQFMTGATLKKVVRRAPAPVLLVPGSAVTAEDRHRLWAGHADDVERHPFASAIRAVVGPSGTVEERSSWH